MIARISKGLPSPNHSSKYFPLVISLNTENYSTVEVLLLSTFCN